MVEHEDFLLRSRRWLPNELLEAGNPWIKVTVGRVKVCAKDGEEVSQSSLAMRFLRNELGKGLRAVQKRFGSKMWSYVGYGKPRNN